MTTPDVSWKTMFKEIKDSQGISLYMRNKILDGWKNLAEILGNDWPALAQEHGHPWIGMWYNKVPWVKAFYGHIGHQLEQLESKKHLGPIVDRLRDPSPNVCLPAQAEINAAWKLKRSKIPFEFVRPYQKNKSPDILTTIGQREVGIEVSILEQSRKYKIQSAIFEKIVSSLMTASFSGLKAAGQIKRMLAHTHADHLVALIEQAKQDALKDDRVVLIEEVAFEGCIVPRSKIGHLQEWKLQRGFGENTILNAPEFDTSTGRRLHAKIMGKSKQIPSDTAGIIYIEGAPLYIDGTGVMTYHFSMEDIEEAVYANTNLLFVALCSHSRVDGPRTRLIGDHTHASRAPRYRLYSEETLVVSNRFTEFPTLRHKRLIKAFLS